MRDRLQEPVLSGMKRTRGTISSWEKVVLYLITGSPRSVSESQVLGSWYTDGTRVPGFDSSHRWASELCVSGESSVRVDLLTHAIHG